MRIVAGTARGRRLVAPSGQHTRPTLERVKEGVFSAVQFWLPGAAVLDLYSGSGQMGLEAVSRGAQSCVFVENDAAAAKALGQNIQALGFEGRCRLYRADVSAFLAGCRDRFDFIWMDPPYAEDTLAGLLPRVAAVAAPDALVLCESGPGAALPDETATLVKEKQYRYGTVMVTRYKNAGTLPDKE